MIKKTLCSALCLLTVLVTEFANASLRTKHWRYIRYTGGSEELYDHCRDPHEWESLANNPEVCRCQDSAGIPC